MVAESLLRILEKRRQEALRLGTFLVPVLGRTALTGRADNLITVHDTVLRPLLDGATECRVYGVSRRSALHKIVSRLGDYSDRVWRLDPGRELLRGSEPLWNSECDHNGIVIVRPLDLDLTGSVLAACGRPDAWSSRYQLHQGASRAAVEYCFAAVSPANGCAFLFSGSNGLEWMDVFADSDDLGLLWDQAVSKRTLTRT